MTPHATTPKQRLRRLASGLLTHTVLVTAAIIMLLPLAWMVSTSLKQSGIGLSRGIEWLPWRDAWARGGQTIDVIVLGARVLPDGAQEAAEVGIKSLASRRRQTRVYVSDGAYDAEILAWRVRPMTGEDETAEAQWAPFDSVRRRLAPEWGNYREALEKMRFWVCLANTLAITFLGTAGTILACSLVAYGFARFRFPGNSFLFLVLLSSMMLPSVVTMIPVYLLFRELHWIDTLLPLFDPAWFSVNAFAVFLFRQYYMTLPFDLDDAAQIDG